MFGNQDLLVLSRQSYLKFNMLCIIYRIIFKEMSYAPQLFGSRWNITGTRDNLIKCFATQGKFRFFKT